MEEVERHMKLLKASEGARELIRMIDSVSNSPNLDTRMKRVARKLLKGARDLQSSLAMLTRREIAGPNPFDVSQFRKCGGGFDEKDDIPPIVIMKPLLTISAKEEIRSTHEEAKKIKDVTAADTTYRTSANNKQENSVEATRTPSELEQDIMCLLLSSRSFVNQAEELFRIDARPPVIRNRKRLGEDVTRNPKLYLDCGKELMVRRSCERDAGGVSLRRLAEEVSRAIEALSSYDSADGGAGPEDDLYVMLERDVECREVMASANWDLGWVKWICNEELNVAVAALEEFIVSWLITETIQDLLWGL